MYWLIEDNDKLEVLINSGYKKAFIDIIPSDHIEHPVYNSISLLYIRPLEADKGYMLGINHDEVISVNKTRIDTLLSKFDTLYCVDKKELLHYLPLKTLYDINVFPNTYIRPLTSTHNIYYSRYPKGENINNIIPVVKHYEMCEELFYNINTQDVFNLKPTDYARFYNDRVSVVFNAIERNGLQIHLQRFERHFYREVHDRVHTRYNTKTLTTRPSNKFKGVNYAALNKQNGCRKSFIPSNDILYEIDISAYHPSLSCRLIDYNFPTSDIHSHLQSLYGVSYAKAKELTFKQLYGGVFKEYEHLEYFSKIKEYIHNMWLDFYGGEEIVCPVSNFVYQKDYYKEMNPQKLFNYLLQNLETSMNVRILWDILKLLRGKKTKLILYTYDSFLFDLAEEEIETIKKIEQVFKKYKFNIKIKQGYDYDFR